MEDGMRRRMFLAAAAVLLAVPVVVLSAGSASASTDVAIATSSFCDSGGNCITQRIWLQKTPSGAGSAYAYRTYVRIWCSHSGVTIACRAVSSDSATLNAESSLATFFKAQVNNTTCTSTSSCGAVVHDAVTGWFIDQAGYVGWLSTGAWSGCPATGAECGSGTYYDTSPWRK